MDIEPTDVDVTGMPPVVTVFGAGISGLSAAHELIERGFLVQVVEPTESATEEYECRVGGIAANQISRVPAAIEALYSDDELSSMIPGGITQQDLARLRKLRVCTMRPTQRRFPLTHRIRFERGGSSAAWASLSDGQTSNNEKLVQVLDALKTAYDEYRRDYELSVAAADSTADPNTYLGAEARRREILYVEVRGFTDGDSTAEANRQTSLVWATWVRDRLGELNDSDPKYSMPSFVDHLHPIGLGDAAPLGDPSSQVDRARSNRVEFRIVEQLIPGEHGFRFFPSCYRHLFDVMRRTPILDKRGDETAETAFDRLVPVPEASLALDQGKAPHDVNTRRIRSLRDLERLGKVLLHELGFTDRDLLLLQTAMLKFVTSCRKRRVNESESVSFWNYVGGDAVGFSAAAKEFIERTPRALAAMSATETDARTQLTLLVQMLIKAPIDGLGDDFTLDASSTDAWLTVWKSFLRQRGVRFFVGKLHELKLRTVAGQPVFLPRTSGPTGWQHPRPERPADRYISAEAAAFFVLATSFDEASRLIGQAYIDHVKSPGAVLTDADFAGPFKQLIGFDVDAKRRDPNTGKRLERKRKIATGSPAEARDPLRDISGIQYFFTHNYRIGRGHVYFLKSQWALTAISQLSYWRDRTRPIGNFIGQSSVDIGDWYEPDAGTSLSAWHSERQKIADATWQQVKVGLEQRLQHSILAPEYYHLDEGVLFSAQQSAGYGGTTVIDCLDAAIGSVLQLSCEVLLQDGTSATIDASHTVQPHDTRTSIAQSLAQKLDLPGERHLVFAHAVGNRILLAPYSDRRRDVVVAVHGVSSTVELRPWLGIWAAGGTTARAVRLDGATPAEVALELANALRGSVVGAESRHVQLPSGALPFAIADPSDLVEIMDGPQLTVRVENRRLQIWRAPQRGFSRRVEATVRNHIEVVMPPTPEPFRTYSIEILTGDGSAFIAIAQGLPTRDSSDQLCKRLGQELQTVLRTAFAPRSIDSIIGIKVRQRSFSPHEWMLDLTVPQASALGPAPVTFAATNMSLLADAVPLRNESPFLINLPDQWHCRPGLFRNKAAQDSITAMPGSDAEFDYCHPDGPFRRWVAAGTYMATHTRMTTMEAANESARHAVNAILQVIKSTPKNTNPMLFNTQGSLMGDPCDIWDPEEHELEDLDYFKQLDHALLEKGLPHFFDILGLRALIERIPPGAGARRELWNELVDMLIQARTCGFANVAAASAFAKAAKI